jgi:hypothetical protein
MLPQRSSLAAKKESLPADHFSKDLNLTSIDEPDENLLFFAKHHRELRSQISNKGNHSLFPCAKAANNHKPHNSDT